MEGDVENDPVINIHDLNDLLFNWGINPPNSEGTLANILVNWLESEPEPPPEPPVIAASVGP